MAKPRLNQVVAVVSGKKAQAAEALTGVYHLFQKATLFEGLDRRFTPRNDSGENKPAERKKPQHTVKELYAKVEPALAELFDGVATQDWGNTQARADVVVDGKVLLSAAPVTFLLFLDKQLQDIRSFVEKLPLRDAAEDWAFQPESGYFATPLSGRLVTAKVQEPLVLYPATEQHPAQTQLITKDVVTGQWDERKFSGAATRADQEALLGRIRKLQEAVKLARETANSAEVDKQRVGSPILDYVFGGILK
jgi:hypothetical protein